jgi:photosystem II stability/assembly factor-like uncharacterized protein
VESDPKLLYVTTAGGGLWKSTNNGTTFVPVFNHESSASTGAVAVAGTDKNIVWVGTGEPASTRANSWGDGIYKSTDGGATWRNMGLHDSRQISTVCIHPTDPNIVYVAAMGYLWGTNSERGIFKTTDGGVTWTKSLFVNDTTGFIDLQMDPVNPSVLYAAAWHRLRWGDGDMTESGAGSGIFKSTDGGGTWERLRQGLPTDPMGKIHLAVGRRNPNIVYANILCGEPAGSSRTSKQGGLFRSEDAGKSWTRVNDRQTNYYYDRVYVDPSDENTVWMPVFELSRSTDGGRTFSMVNMRHVHNDLHSMWIDPNDPSHIALSGDGGVSISFDRCATYQQTVLPIAQFYEIAVDNQDPYSIIGGMQDTGHWLLPNRTYDEEGLTAHDCIKLRYNGDGMGSAMDPRDPNIIYMVQEFGNTSRLDMKHWDRTELQPTDTLEFRKRGLDHPVRWDWTPAFALSRHNPDYLYLGSNYLFRIRGATGEWTAISPDLSRQQARSPKGWRDGFHSYGALFSVAESPLDASTLWAGSDDGALWVTTDRGKRWSQLDAHLPSGAPLDAVVACIEPSHVSKTTAYVVYDNHTREDLRPYVYKTTDLGATWTSLAATLPSNGPALVIREHPRNPGVLFLGQEFGVYVSIDGGGSWTTMNGNLPTAGIRCMLIQPAANDLIVGTFGRGLWVTDISPFSSMSARVLQEPLHLFAPESAVKFKFRETYGNTIEELNGDMFFRGENPPYGAVINYWLKSGIGDSVVVTVADGKGRTLRTLRGSGTAGMNQVVWNLRPDKLTPADSLELKKDRTPGERDYFMQVPIGTYAVHVAAGSLTATASVRVRKEGDGVKVGNVRK